MSGRENVVVGLEARLHSYVPDLARHPDDYFAIDSIHEAIAALKEGNFGAGCVIVTPNGTIVRRAHNGVFHPRFDSGGHAECRAISEFEATNMGSLRQYKVVASLEPCPMCTCRLITAGCGTVRYVAADPHGGMVRFIDRLPGEWSRLAAEISWAQASCSNYLQILALDVFEASLALNDALRAR